MDKKLDHKELLKAGVHFGHLTRKWNPKMSEYIFMHPAAEVEPANVKNIVQFLYKSISLKILEALAASLEVKDIFPTTAIA